MRRPVRGDGELRGAGGDQDRHAGGGAGHLREKIVAQIPVGRSASPDEIAAVHVFLASDEAAFIAGQVIFADGGRSVGI